MKKVSKTIKKKRSKHISVPVEQWKRMHKRLNEIWKLEQKLDLIFEALLMMKLKDSVRFRGDFVEGLALMDLPDTWKDTIKPYVLAVERSKAEAEATELPL